jgi:hypothetical protein
MYLHPCIPLFTSLFLPQTTPQHQLTLSREHRDLAAPKTAKNAASAEMALLILERSAIKARSMDSGTRAALQIVLVSVSVEMDMLIQASNAISVPSTDNGIQDAQPTAPVLPSAVRLTPTSSHYVNTNSFTGDGHVDPGEQCDLGPLNGQWNSGCSANCTCTPVCGNGIVEEGESCDLGSQNGVFNSGCSKNCTCTPVCGNGIKE